MFYFAGDHSWRGVSGNSAGVGTLAKLSAEAGGSAERTACPAAAGGSSLARPRQPTTSMPHRPVAHPYCYEPM